MASFKIAAKMGLRSIDDFKAGRTILRNKGRDAEALIIHAWRASICPTFGPSPALIMVCRGERIRGQMAPEFHKAGLALCEHQAGTASYDPGQLAVIDIEHDPVRAAAADLDLMAHSGTVSRDGIGYDLEFNSFDCRASLAFRNPQADCLLKLKKALHELAQQIVMQSRVKPLRKFTEELERLYF